ncbi:MAG: orotidine-5'-phosphate decarboxylase [Bacteroidetes bacterium]|nr:orotidine-5'-phosphate decarboxylase [Bacteroidota bacterium]HET6245261.1 orotidine-5'-phosphate decarboxylase [Bacteroidia bacterium]
MNKSEIIAQIRKKKSFLCVGLDTDVDQIPEHLLEFQDPVFEFNRQIILATQELCIAYKPNIAFYECLGVKGWQALEKTMHLIPKDIFTIADAKRGDIGNTSKRYADTFFGNGATGLDFDSITVAPYMGADSVKPFLDYPGKWAVLLGLTSNPGAMDFQFIPTSIDDQKVYEKVLIRSQKWGSEENLMYVIGATRSDLLTKVRKLIPNHFLLIPGVGAQGGDLTSVAEFGMTKECGLIVNAARSIIYASKGKDFAERAREEALKIQKEMELLLQKKNVI